MIDPTSILFGNPISNYTVVLVLGLPISMAWLIWRMPAHQRMTTLDVCLAALLGGIIVGRLGHVALNWAFFTDRMSLIWRMNAEGGLLWQGCLLGALLFGWAMARWRNVDSNSLLWHSSLIVPWLALCGWYACDAANCAYGLPVERVADYPAWETWVAPDIFGIAMPRFATQRIGAYLSFGVLLITLCIYLWYSWRGKSNRWLLGLALLGVTVTNAYVATLRGDYSLVLAEMRVGQWLNLAITALTLLVCLMSLLRPKAARDAS